MLFFKSYMGGQALEEEVSWEGKDSAVVSFWSLTALILMKSPLVNPSSWGSVEGPAARAMLYGGKAMEWQVVFLSCVLNLFWPAFLLYKMNWGMKRESKWPWWSLPALPPHGSMHCSAGCWSHSFILFHQRLRWCSMRLKNKDQAGLGLNQGTSACWLSDLVHVT